ERNGFVYERPRILEPDPLQPAVSGLRAFEAEGAGEIAGGARVKPQLPQREGLYVAARFASGCKEQRIELRLHEGDRRCCLGSAIIQWTISARQSFRRHAERVAECEPPVVQRTAPPAVALPSARRDGDAFRQPDESTTLS